MQIPIAYRGLPVLLLAVALASFEASAQTWAEHNKGLLCPPARCRHGMAYDAARQLVVLFGGAVAGVGEGYDTWEWDGSVWRPRMLTVDPPGRDAHAMAYDTLRKRVVLFGGVGGGALGDTWEWDGSTWVMRSPPAGSPSPRRLHAMVYDAARQRTLLFGGAAPFVPANDTWEWDGTSWVQRWPVTNPLGRAYHAMAYDAARQRVVLFGGCTPSALLGDTWEWDGNDWAQRQPRTSPPPRMAHAMAYDAARQRVVLFGGYDAVTPVGDTWEWDGTNWVQRWPITNPLGRAYHAMTYDAARQRVVLFGGNDFVVLLDDTWEYGFAATLAPSGAPRIGGTVSLLLTAAVDPGRPYQLGSSLGTGPIPIDTRKIDLSPDALLTVSVAGQWPAVFSGYRGVLDYRGQAQAAIHIPNVPALVGARLYTAFITLDPNAPSGIGSISAAEMIGITP